jgi:signal transduction histidine kinase
MVRATRRPEYVVVSYIEPRAGNEQALGYDASSDPARFDALQRARDSGWAIATGRLTLVQEAGRRFGLLIFQPIYSHGPPPSTVEERRQRLLGYATGVFRLGDMIEASLQGAERNGITLRIEDEEAPAGQRLLYNSQGETDPTLDHAAGNNPSRMHWDTTIELADRRWALRLAPTLGYLAARQSLQPWMVLVGGLLFTSLLGAFLLIVTGRSVLIEHVVAERTAELSQTNAALAREIADREQAEQALRQTAAELAQSNAELAQFAYVASHDLQEPLRAVTGCVQLLQQRYCDQLNAPAHELIAHAVTGAIRMHTLIHDLLAYSRVGTRGESLQLTDCAAVLNEVLANLEISICESGAVVTAAPLPTVMVDPAQLRQVFQNLIGNALKFRGEAPPRIHIGAEHEGGEWVFAVCDNGIGIHPQYFERIFQVFQRLHTQRKYEGSGIGLAICKKIVERHSGRIWVTSEPGKGATFSFTVIDRS